MAVVLLGGCLDALVVGLGDEVGQVWPVRLVGEGDGVASRREDGQGRSPTTLEVLGPVRRVVAFLRVVPRRTLHGDGLVPELEVYFGPNPVSENLFFFLPLCRIFCGGDSVI